MPELTVQGSDEIQKMFQNFKKGIRGKVVRKPLRTLAKKIQQSAKRVAPRDEGDLRKAIKVRAMKRSRKRLAGVRVFVDPSLPRTGRRHTRRAAGAFTEYGTENQSPRPYLRPSFDAHQASGVADMFDEIKQMIREEAMKIP